MDLIINIKMKKELPLAIALLLSFSLLVSAHDDHPEVSRVGKNIALVVEVSTPGASTPSKLFNQVKNNIDEPKYTNYLTEVG